MRAFALCANSGVPETAATHGGESLFDYIELFQ
jgi:hypothetical protein